MMYSLPKKRSRREWGDHLKSAIPVEKIPDVRVTVFSQGSILEA
jgi:hypothetical protein